ncbi:hypothetical protein [Stenotrophomonas phage SOVA965]
MSYEKIDGVPVREGEFAVKLDTDDIVAISINRSVSASRIQFLGMARAIDEEGSQRFNYAFAPIISEIAYSDTRARVVDYITKDCILALLGEKPEFISWSEQFLMDVSIRQAILISDVATGGFDASNLI